MGIYRNIHFDSVPFFLPLSIHQPFLVTSSPFLLFAHYDYLNLLAQRFLSFLFAFILHVAILNILDEVEHIKNSILFHHEIGVTYNCITIRMSCIYIETCMRDKENAGVQG